MPEITQHAAALCSYQAVRACRKIYQVPAWVHILFWQQVCGNQRSAAELRNWLLEWRPRRVQAAGKAMPLGSDSDGEWRQVTPICS
jgi:hypothetical protein